MSIAAAVLERDLDAVQATTEVEPVHPKWGSRTGAERNLRAIPGAKKESFEELEQRHNEWLTRAKSEAEKATLAASTSTDSPTAWTRAAFAQASAGDAASACESAKRAASLALAPTAGSDYLDVPALTAAVSILVSLGGDEVPEEIAQMMGDHPELRGLKAELLAATAGWRRALRLLDPLPDPSYAGLAGYLLLRAGQPHRAIRSLRQALVQNERDVAAWVNLSLALRESGSIRKALRAAAAAVAISPGRVDAEHIYLDLLWAADQGDVLEREIARLDSQGTSPTPEMLLAKARLAIRSGKSREVGFILRHAERLANESDQMRLAAEIRGNRAVIAYASKDLDRAAARKQVLDALEDAPTSVALADMLGALSYHREEAKDLVPLVETHATDSSTLAFSLRTRTAYLLGDWAACITAVNQWIERFPGDANAITALLSVAGHIDNDWARAVAAARSAARRLRPSALLSNQVAYALALGGDPAGALEVLAKAPSWNYRLEATKGLAELARGRFSDGLARYVRASNMIQDSDDEDDHALLRAHLQMGLRTLGMWSDETAKQVAACGLGVVPPPRNWRDIPSFAALQHRAALNGWPWPLLDVELRQRD